MDNIIVFKIKIKMISLRWNLNIMKDDTFLKNIEYH